MTAERFLSPSTYAPIIGFSSAVRVEGLVFISGTTAAGPDGDVVGLDDAAAQTREILRKLEAVLKTAGTDLSRVVQTRIYLTRVEDWEAVGEAHGEAFTDVRPATTMIVVAGLLDARMLVEIEAVAVV